MADRAAVPGEAARFGKHAGAFRTIGEVAEDLDVPQHVLRFWESRFAQLRPLKRAGGRRYYRPDDVDLIRGIRRLLHGQGYTIKGAQRVLRQGGVRLVQAIGRGEAEAGAPSPERDAAEDETHDAAPGDPAPEGPGGAGEDAAEATGIVLRGVLDELRACRTALARLRAVAGDEASPYGDGADGEG